MAIATIAARDTHKTSAREASTQTDSGATNLELLQGVPTEPAARAAGFFIPGSAG
jgi:hypothetical protein